MSFRRFPFQFTATDPAARQAELMRRFGVPSDGDMLVETPNSTLVNGFCGPSSPRLQHRVPHFVSEGREAMRKESTAENVDTGKPRSRVIPIQIEGVSNDRPARQRTRSGGSIQNSHLVPEDKIRSSSNSSLPVSPEFDHNRGSLEKEVAVSAESKQTSTKPKVINIPIFVEGRDDKENFRKQKSNGIQINVQKMPTTAAKTNGPCTSKVADKSAKEPEKKRPDFDDSLERISSVIRELESYKEGIDNFDGVHGDKQYRYLDEMLTRCLLKLDNVETYGNEEVRKARKAGIKEVEHWLCILESKAAKDPLTKEKNDKSDFGSKQDVEGMEVVCGNASEVAAECIPEKNANGDVGSNQEEMETAICTGAIENIEGVKAESDGSQETGSLSTIIEPSDLEMCCDKSTVVEGETAEHSENEPVTESTANEENKDVGMEWEEGKAKPEELLNGQNQVKGKVEGSNEPKSTENSDIVDKECTKAEVQLVGDGKEDN